jgi:transglutaminase-like putative cysteine protease
MSKKSTSEAFRRDSLFGPPSVLEGEDSAAYDELVGRVYAAVKPVDVIYEIFIADVVSLEWEVLRWRRLKFSLIRSHAHRALTEFLGKRLEYNLYREQFTEDLTEFLESTLPEDDAKDSARKLARDCARDQADAVDKVNGILARNRTNIEYLLNEAQNKKAEKLCSGVRAG